MRVWLCGGRESGTEREREKEEGREGERVGQRERGEKGGGKGFAITLLNRPRLVQHPEAAESPVEADASDDQDAPVPATSLPVQAHGRQHRHGVRHPQGGELVAGCGLPGHVVRASSRREDDERFPAVRERHQGPDAGGARNVIRALPGPP